MEEKLISLESEAGFRVLFECATVGVLVVNERGGIELANPCAGILFGYEPAELIGQSVETLIPDGLRERHMHHRASYFARPKSRPMGLGMELYARKRSGEVFPVAISLGHYKLEGEKLAVAFVTDITDHVVAKKLTAEREAWFRNMADNSPVMIWVSGVNKNCTYFNNTWLSYTGRSLQEELGSGWAMGIHPDDLEQCLLRYNDAFDKHEPFRMEYRLRRHDGQYRWVEHVGNPTYVDHIFTGFVGSCSDVHDQRMRQEELEELIRLRTEALYRALDREKMLSDSKSRFVSMASHEFRTPLSVVLSSTTLIEQFGIAAKDERIQKHVNRIKSSIHTLTNVLDDFLSLDKLEEGTVVIEYDTFDIRDFVQGIVEDVQFIRKSGQIIITEHTGDGRVVLDQRKLRYILVNLLSNAIKYSSEDVAVYVSSVVDEKYISLSVRDRGIGIPEDEQRHLFTKFFRANNTGSIQGTGLGLTIVKQYVELMAGTISFVSRAGEGTTFIIRLPQQLLVREC